MTIFNAHDKKVFAEQLLGAASVDDADYSQRVEKLRDFYAKAVRYTAGNRPTPGLVNRKTLLSDLRDKGHSALFPIFEVYFEEVLDDNDTEGSSEKKQQVNKEQLYKDAYRHANADGFVRE